MLEVSLATRQQAFQLELQFCAERGQTTVLLGESGAGKSTLLRLIAGLQKPQHGYVRLNGVPYYDSAQKIAVPPQARPFGYVFQDYVLFPHLTVFENVAFGLRAQRLPRAHITRQVKEALAQVHLTGYDQRLPTQLSGGQQQRVALARALALQPELLLLDEPLSALDIQTRRQVRQELLGILRETQQTTLMVTHHYLDSLLFGDQILVLDQGKIIQQGTPQELREHPRSSYIAELIGANFFRGTIIGQETSTTFVVQLAGTKAQQRPLQLIVTMKEPLDQEAIAGEAYVLIDPRSVTLHTIMPEGSARNVLSGAVQHMVPIGLASDSQHGYIRVSISVPQLSMPLIVEITEASVSRLHLAEGAKVFASFKATEANAYV